MHLRGFPAPDGGPLQMAAGGVAIVTSLWFMYTAGRYNERGFQIVALPVPGFLEVRCWRCCGTNLYGSAD